MIYALNLYDIIDGKQDTYREYMRATAPLLNGLDAEPVVACHNPLKKISGNARQHLLVMKFGSMQDFEALMRRQEDAGVDELREMSTENYIWTLYEEWEIGSWLFSADP